LRAQRRIALCTNKPQHLTSAVLSSLGWQETFDYVAAPLPGDRVKPEPYLLRKVAEALLVAEEELVMIGDSPQDIAAGKAIGAYTVGVKGGFLPVERLIAAEPDLLLESLDELTYHLENLGL
jgi:phosphoglycolate phosphatase